MRPLHRLLLLPVMLLAHWAMAQQTPWLKPRMFKVTPYLYNSAHTDIPLCFQGDYLLFTSDRARKNSADKPARDFNIFSSHSEYGKIHLAPFALDKRINTRAHETGAAWSLLENRLYFSRGSLSLKPLPAARNLPNLAGLFSSSRIAAKFETPVQAPWGAGAILLSPAVSEQGDLLIFASNEGKGYGGFDLYLSRFVEGKWTDPVNLGPEINTSGNELFPCIARDGEQVLLFFSSDGQRDNLGGYDLYMAKGKGTEFAYLGALAEPFNSLSNDIGFTLRRDLRSGYFGSDRNASGNLDIFAFDQHYLLYGSLNSKTDGKPIADALVRIRNSSNDQIVTVQTDSVGSFYYPYSPLSTLMLTALAAGYDSVSQVLDPEPKLPMSRSRVHTMSMTPNRRMGVEGTISRNDLPLAGVKVYLHAEGSAALDSAVTGPGGRFGFNLQPGKDYFVVSEKEGLRTQVTELSTQKLKAASTLRIGIRMQAGDFLLVEGQVISLDRTTPLENIPVRVIDNTTNRVVDTIYTRRNGFFWLSVPMDSLSNYSVIASSHGYLSTRMDVERDSVGAKKVVLKLKVPEFGEDKLVKVIYYPYNSAVLTPISRKDINELYYFLIENPEVNLELGSHTDARGSNAYNQTLSEQRAQSALTFVLERKEIPADRMSWKGYGESVPTNNCVDGHPCTEEGYQLNRRTEFRVRLRSM
jgi:outer membrane protein OmpA-like peptidoglycan-associated protein